MNKKAFTLIELLVVVAVLALLASIVFSNLGGAREGARISNVLSFQSQTHSLLGSDLVGWWNFNEGDARDISGYDNHGAIIGGATYTDGVQGTGGSALEFDDEDDYVLVNHSIELNLQTYTYAFWMYRRQNHTGSWRQFLDRSNRSPSFWFHNNRSDRIHISIRDEDGNLQGYDYDIESGVTLNAWHYIILTAEYNGTETEMKSYLDGELSNDHIFNSAPELGTGDLYFGKQDFMIDDVRIYSRSLTASEIKTLYAQTKDKYLVNE